MPEAVSDGLEEGGAVTARPPRRLKEMRSSSTRVPQVMSGRMQERRASSRFDSGTMMAVPHRMSPSAGAPNFERMRGTTLAENMGRNSDGGPGIATTSADPTAPWKPGAVPFGLAMSVKPRGAVACFRFVSETVRPGNARGAFPTHPGESPAEPRHLRNDLACQVVRGGTETAADQDEACLCARARQLGPEDCRLIRDLAGAAHREAERGKLARQETGVGILDDAFGQLRARRDEDGGLFFTHSVLFS